MSTVLTDTVLIGGVTGCALIRLSQPQPPAASHKWVTRLLSFSLFPALRAVLKSIQCVAEHPPTTPINPCAVPPLPLQEWGFSPEASFVAAPPVGPSTTVSLVALADLGQAEDDGSMGGDGEMGPSLNTTGGHTKDLCLIPVCARSVCVQTVSIVDTGFAVVCGGQRGGLSPGSLLAATPTPQCGTT